MFFKTLAIVISFIPLLVAQSNTDKQKESIDKNQVINVTERNITKPFNAICPVKDLPVKANVPEMIYKDKIIGFCCKGCDEVFINNPNYYEEKLKLKDK